MNCKVTYKDLTKDKVFELEGTFEDEPGMLPVTHKIRIAGLHGVSAGWVFCEINGISKRYALDSIEIAANDNETTLRVFEE